MGCDGGWAGSNSHDFTTRVDPSLGTHCFLGSSVDVVRQGHVLRNQFSTELLGASRPYPPKGAWGRGPGRRRPGATTAATFPGGRQACWQEALGATREHLQAIMKDDFCPLWPERARIRRWNPARNVGKALNLPHLWGKSYLEFPALGNGEERQSGFFEAWEEFELLLVKRAP